MIGESGSPRRQVRSPRVSAAAGQVVRAARQADPGEEAEEEQITSPADLCSCLLRRIAPRFACPIPSSATPAGPASRPGRWRRGQCRLAARTGHSLSASGRRRRDRRLRRRSRRPQRPEPRSVARATSSSTARSVPAPLPPPPRLNANAPRCTCESASASIAFRSATLVSSSRNAVPVPEPQPAASTASRQNTCQPVPRLRVKSTYHLAHHLEGPTCSGPQRSSRSSIARCHRHHRHPDRALASGGAERPGRSRPGELHEQPQADRPRPAQLPRYHGPLSRRRHRRGQTDLLDDGHATGFTYLLPHMEQANLQNLYRFDRPWHDNANYTAVSTA